jgi:choline dehydrogenase-like flavoprotein
VEQDALLARWERDPVMRAPLTLFSLIYKFVHFDAPEVYEPMGGRLQVVQTLEEPRWLRQVHRAETWEETDDVECEVVVIGTGAGGAVVGRELADRGFAVVFVEEGEHHRRDAFTGSSVNAHKRFYRGAISLGNVMMPVLIGRLVGGSTAVNGATCFRTPPWVLDRWCETMRTDDFAPDRMKPYFERVEEIIEVAPAPRSQIGPVADVIARGCDALGWSHFAIRRNAPGCQSSGFCDFGCRTDARRSTNLSYVPPALERGAMLFTGARAERVLIENGRATGVEAIAKNGRVLRVRARAVILAGGAVPTPAFLLKQGICNTSGEVGRNLTLHPSTGISAIFDDEIRGYRHIPQGYGCDHFLRDGELITAAQADLNYTPILVPFTGRRLMEIVDAHDHFASFAVLIADESRGRVYRDVAGLPAIQYNVSRTDSRRIQRGLVHLAEMAVAAGAKKIFPALLGYGSFEPGELDRFRRHTMSPSEMLLTSYHPLGTCKMGNDPRSSVVGLDHETHDVRGLFIVDGSTVQGPLGVNPQLTIMAVATRAADRIAAKLGD